MDRYIKSEVSQIYFTNVVYIEVSEVMKIILMSNYL